MMKALLFPTEFSASAENVEKYATEMAKIRDSKLYLLHIDNNEERTYYTPISYNDQLEVVQEDFQMGLKEIVRKYQLEDVPHECLVKEGEITKTILDTIVELDIDIVIMGNNENENFNRRSSHATEVVRKTQCSVLIVPKSASYKPITNIVYATDLIHRDRKSLKRLKRFAETFNAKVTLLHVDVDGKDKPGNAPLKSMKEITDEIDLAGIETKVVVASSLIFGLQEYVRENDVDIVAMTSHSNAFFDKYFRDTNIEKVTLSGFVPLLILHNSE